MAAYADDDDLEAYAPDLDLTGVDVAKLLDDATFDVDQVMGARARLTTGDYAGRLLDPSVLRDWERVALVRATCAQAEHLQLVKNADTARIAALEAGDRVALERGPEIELRYDVSQLPGAAGAYRFYGDVYAPKMARELQAISHLRVLSGRAAASAWRTAWQTGF